MGEWQDISTAPKDEDVLIFCPDAAEPRVMQAAYVVFVDNRAVEVESGWVHPWNNIDNFIDTEPTHWMPLPEPPQATES